MMVCVLQPTTNCRISYVPSAITQMSHARTHSGTHSGTHARTHSGTRTRAHARVNEGAGGNVQRLVAHHQCSCNSCRHFSQLPTFRSLLKKHLQRHWSKALVQTCMQHSGTTEACSYTHPYTYPHTYADIRVYHTI